MASVSYGNVKILSEDEICKLKKNPSGEWSAANQEVESLVNLNESFGCSRVTHVKKNKSYPGGAVGKCKPRFSFSSHLANKEGCFSAASKILENVSDNFLVPDDIIDDADEVEDGSEHSHYHLKEQSVSEFLDCFKQGSSSHLLLPPENSELAATLDDDDDDDLPEVSEYSSPSGADDEEIPKNMVAAIPVRTMGDQFHDAVGMLPSDDDPQFSQGIYGNLMRVIQREKDRDTDYMKHIHTETRHDDREMNMLVKILSKAVEAKLIVCSCTPYDKGLGSRIEMEGKARTLSIIFNTKVCNDVELEIGNMICIHQPWKEVYVKEKKEAVYLCSYFSQVSGYVG